MTHNTMKKRWISLFVENQAGVLSKISGLFSGKAYNLDSLTVGTTEDPTVSRMTIVTIADDETYEQIKHSISITHVSMSSLNINITFEAKAPTMVPADRFALHTPTGILIIVT